MKIIEFNAPKSDAKLIKKIALRAQSNVLTGSYDPLTCRMDLMAVHCNGCPLDLQKLLEADDFDFVHDLHGIFKHINRSTAQLERCFLPRCAK